jgi:mannose-6-phosphate isomerase
VSTSPQTGEDDAQARWVVSTRMVPKPWGHEEIYAHVPGGFAGKALHVRAGCALSLQYHEHKDEVIALQSGAIRLEIGPSRDALEVVHLRPGDAVRVLPGTIHRLTALVDSVVLEASTDDLDDVVRLDDRYGREGTTAP